MVEFIKKIHPPNLKRKVRWYHKRFGLFGYQFLKDKMQVTEEEYNAALCKLKPLKKKRPGKNVLKRFGRYYEMEKNLNQYRVSGDISFLLKAQQLRKNMSKPYQLKVVYNKQRVVYSYRATVGYNQILKLQQLAYSVTSHAEFEKLSKKEMQYDAS